MKYYAVIDTNVFVSALLAKRVDSPPVTVVEKLFDSTVVPVFSKAILKEYFEVLHRANSVSIRLRSMFFFGMWHKEVFFLNPGIWTSYCQI